MSRRNQPSSKHCKTKIARVEFNNLSTADLSQIALRDIKTESTEPQMFVPSGLKSEIKIDAVTARVARDILFERALTKDIKAKDAYIQTQDQIFEKNIEAETATLKARFMKSFDGLAETWNNDRANFAGKLERFNAEFRDLGIKLEPSHFEGSTNICKCDTEYVTE